MKNWIKDRYTYLFIIYAILFVAMCLWAHFRPKGIPGLKIGLIAFACITAYALYLITRAGRYHWEEEHPLIIDVLNGFDIMFKANDGCGFTYEAPIDHRVDGIKTNGKRYKVVNGADVVIHYDGRVKPAGPGSTLMQVLGGGMEPRHIQGDECWR